MLSEWEKEEEEADSKKKVDTSDHPSKLPNSVLPGKQSSRFPPVSQNNSTSKHPQSSISNEHQNDKKMKDNDMENSVVRNTSDTKTALSNSDNGTLEDSFSQKEKPGGILVHSEGNDSLHDILPTANKKEQLEPDITSTERTRTAKKAETEQNVPSDNDAASKTTSGMPIVPHAELDSSVQPTVTCVLPEIPENADAVISNCM